MCGFFLNNKNKQEKRKIVTNPMPERIQKKEKPNKDIFLLFKYICTLFSLSLSKIYVYFNFILCYFLSKKMYGLFIDFIQFFVFIKISLSTILRPIFYDLLSSYLHSISIQIYIYLDIKITVNTFKFISFF